MSLKSLVIGAGFAAMRAPPVRRLLAQPGAGVVLALHRVRPFHPRTPDFAPNRLLEVTPGYFEAALTHIAAQGFAFVTLDEAVRRLREGGAPFAALTFDDGYRDFREFALPVLERHHAPATLFLAPGLIENAARLWWLELEEAVRRLDTVALGPEGQRLPARTPAEKGAAYERVYWSLRARPEAELLDAVAALAAEAGVARADLDADFLDWEAAAAVARHPLVAIGAHSLTHRRLAQWPEPHARAEIFDSRAVLAQRLGVAVTSFAYPVGDPTSAGPREFALAREAGYACAVTTRPGLVHPEHAQHLHALPRVSLNGHWQDVGHLDALLSGAAFRLWNRGRRLNVA